jgi:hypothetical protein
MATPFTNCAIRILGQAPVPYQSLDMLVSPVGVGKTTSLHVLYELNDLPLLYFTLGLYCPIAVTTGKSM